MEMYRGYVVDYRSDVDYWLVKRNEEDSYSLHMANSYDEALAWIDYQVDGVAILNLDNPSDVHNLFKSIFGE